ncbi:riboflavin biosynthesis protein RibF [Lacticaseibacillus pabuli]|uniref:Riboflavin biosynthesis protein n=1 Tax=Lacticaseibacillus pabuli TaxID=3025672 RepID=A0ABY7WUA5_9LACO|nr:riboflavin biosynthesis protein RibF [Lacticaseibacillus sp. KACC 23028]WDF83748.1 riboflavin biosynthesis protein RibF [Lacticaseibacillus sp. KACC 23028]
MRTINVMPPLQAKDRPTEPVVLVLGFFDGVHKGHQQVIAAGRREADRRGLKLALMTFDEHPAIVYGGVDAASFKYLSLPERKAELMAQFGVDDYYVIHFTKEFAALKPQQFVDDYMCGLNAQVVVAGFDYTYGKKDVASMALLPGYAKGRFEVVTVPCFDENGQKVSSTHIRQALDNADIDLANDLLGYHYTTRGTVVHGEARGRELGFPTANIDHDHGTYVPGIGIYVVRLTVDGTTFGGMASVGRNVTFGDDRDVTVEINLFDFKRDIYGKTVTVEWLHYLRGEVKYTGADALVAQLKRDEVQSRDYLKQ